MSRPIHIIRWRDNFHRTRWHDAEDLDLEPPEITSIGYLARETEEVVALSTTIEEPDGAANHTQMILRDCIIEHEIVDLATKRKRKKR